MSAFDVGGIYIVEGPMNEDNQLLRQYAEERSEKAFGQLVERYLDLVYCAALRKLGGDAQVAQEVAQMVFSKLARKARSMPREVVLGGWLYRDACLTAAQAMRTERRRRAREQEAMAMNALNPEPEPGWERLAPYLDDAMQRLRAHDRDAIVLRYFQGRDLRSVGEALGTSEEGARKRVSRAVDKLRAFFQERGLTLSAATLASLVAGNAVTAAPAGLVASIAGPALASAALAGTGVAQLLMEVMAASKVKAGLVGVLCVAGLTAPPGIHYPPEAQAHNFGAESKAIYSTQSPYVAMKTISRWSALTTIGIGAALSVGQGWSNELAKPALDLATPNETASASAGSRDSQLGNNLQPWPALGQWAPPAPLAPRSPKSARQPTTPPSSSGLVNQGLVPDPSTAADVRPSAQAAAATDDAAQQKSLSSAASQTASASSAIPSQNPVAQPVPAPAVPGSPKPPAATGFAFSAISASGNGPPQPLTNIFFFPTNVFVFSSTNLVGATNGPVWGLTFTNVGGGGFSGFLLWPATKSHLRITRDSGQAPHADSVRVTWDSDPNVHLQTSPSLSRAVWTDVPNTQGKGSAILPVSTASGFFRTVYGTQLMTWGITFAPVTPPKP